jgi:hypothetical protein
MIPIPIAHAERPDGRDDNGDDFFDDGDSDGHSDYQVGVDGSLSRDFDDGDGLHAGPAAGGDGSVLIPVQLHSFGQIAADAGAVLPPVVTPHTGGAEAASDESYFAAIDAIVAFRPAGILASKLDRVAVKRRNINYQVNAVIVPLPPFDSALLHLARSWRRPRRLA